MDSINYPRNLIRYASEHSLQGQKTRRFKLKNIGYALALLLTVTILAYSVATRTQIEMAVRQIRQPISVTLSDGREQNRYEVKINNKTSVVAHYRLTLEGLPGAELDTGGSNSFSINPESSLKFIAFVRLHPNEVKQEKTPFRFVLLPEASAHEEKGEWDSVFFTPESRLGK